MAIEFPADKFVNDTHEYGGMTYVWDGEKWTASGAAAFEDAYVNVSGDTMTGDLTVPSLNRGPLAGLRNILINGDFRIWQRGDGPFTSTTANQLYTADRWAIGADGGRNGTVTKQTALGKFPDGFTTAVRVSADAPALVQKIELFDNKMAPFVAGQVWTLSLWSTVDITTTKPFLSFQDSTGNTTGSTTQTNFVNTGEPSSNGFERYSSTITIVEPSGVGTDLKNAILGITAHRSNGVNQEIRYAGIQLEPGPIATPFEHRHYGLELDLCRRYYQTALASSLVFNVASTAATTAYGAIPLTTPMRIGAPTIDSGDAFLFLDRSGGTETESAIYEIAYANSSCARVRYNRVSSAANEYRRLHKVKNTSNGDEKDLIRLDAEL